MTRRILLSHLCSLSLLGAQELSIEPIRPSAFIFRRPYLGAEVPPVRLANSGRLRDLVRAGNLYLTVQDALALALENNVDLEIARYNPILSAWQLQRSEAGGALPGVPSAAAQAGSVASGQGVAGSQAAAGVTIGGVRTGNGTGNATITQVGPVTQNLDPSIQETTAFSHTSTPQANATQSITSILVTKTRAYTLSLQQGFLSGGSATLTYSEHYLNENAPTDVLNPSSAPSLAISFQHNLLRGFGVGVNSRTIAVSKTNLKTSDLNFRTQVIGVVVNVLNLYYGLVAADEDVKAKQSALDVAQQFYENNKQQVEIGTLAPLDVTTAEARVASSQNDLLVSQTNLQQQEVRLKNVLSRTGVADPVLATARIVALDRIAVPDQDDLPPLKELVEKALVNRSDLAAQLSSVTNAEISALGTRNGVLPSLQVIGGETQAGLAGTARPASLFGFADPYFVGGVGTGLGQVFRRDFPTERIGAFFQASIGNHQAQADYGIDQLQLRQTQLSTRKQFNQVMVDVSNYAVALHQARVRHEAALKNRALQEQLLAAEREKFSLGASTPFNVLQQQRDLTAAQSTELSALVAYNDARVALDQTLGTTLEANHVSISNAGLRPASGH